LRVALQLFDRHRDLVPDYGPLVFTDAAQLVRPSLRVHDCVLPVLANQQYRSAKDIGIVDHGDWSLSSLCSQQVPAFEKREPPPAGLDQYVGAQLEPGDPRAGRS
jgi:hypothetical protein